MITQLRAAVAKQETVNAEQQTKMESFTAALKAQAARIQKVNDQLQVNKAARRVLAER
jgi:hypothetical protein